MSDLFDGKMYCDKDQEWCPPQRRRNRVNTTWSHAQSPFLPRGAAFRNSRGIDRHQSFSEESNEETSSYGLARKVPSFYKGKRCPAREREASPASPDFAHTRPRIAGKKRLQQTGVICRPFVPYTQTGPQSVASGCESKQREHDGVTVGSSTTQEAEVRQEGQKEKLISVSRCEEPGTDSVTEQQQQKLRNDIVSRDEEVGVRFGHGPRQESEMSGSENSPRWSSDRSLPSSVERRSDCPYTQARRQCGSTFKASNNSRIRGDPQQRQRSPDRAQRRKGRNTNCSEIRTSSTSSRGSISSRTSSGSRNEAKELLSTTPSGYRRQQIKKHNTGSHNFGKKGAASRSGSVSGELEASWTPTKARLPGVNHAISGKDTEERGDSGKSDLPVEDRSRSVSSRTVSTERSHSRQSILKCNERERRNKSCTHRTSTGTSGDALAGSSLHSTRHDVTKDCHRSNSAAATELPTVPTDSRCHGRSPNYNEYHSRSSNTSSSLKCNHEKSFRGDGGESASESSGFFRKDSRRNYSRLAFRQTERSRSTSVLTWRSRSISARRSRSERSCFSTDRNCLVGDRLECGAFHRQRPWWKRKMWGGARRRRGDFHGREEREERGAGWRRDDDDGINPRWRSRRRNSGYSLHRNYDRRSPTYDSEEEYRRSRSREKARRKKQNETIQRYCRTSEGNYQVFWDGFQWVKKSDQKGSQLLYDQQMNATRRARRLHVGNLPLHMEDITEESFKQHLWKVMKENWACKDPAVCPILHVWFARDRGGNYGFMEMASVEEAHAALRLDGLLWHGVPIRINRPTEWKNSIYDGSALGMLAGQGKKGRFIYFYKHLLSCPSQFTMLLHQSAGRNSPRDLLARLFDPVCSASGLALAESLAAAAQQAAATGNNSGLLSLIASLPEDQRAAAIELVGRQLIAQRTVHLPFDLVQAQIQAELLRGAPSRVVHVTCPAATEVESDADYEEILNDILSECNKHGHALAALIVTPHLEECLPSTSAGDVYLEYATCIQADNIILTFAGRMFDGKPLQLQRFNELAWRQSFQKHAKHLFAHVLSETIESHKKKTDTTADTVPGKTAVEGGETNDRDGTPVNRTRGSAQEDHALVAAAAAAAAAGAGDCETIAAACMAGAAAAVKFLGNSNAKLLLPFRLPPLTDTGVDSTEEQYSTAEGLGANEDAGTQGEAIEAELREQTESMRETDKMSKTASARDSISTTCSL